MLEVYGQGEPHRLFNRVDHHARGLGPLIAPILLAVVDALGRDPGHHRIHFGKGWNSTNIYFENGSVVALRGRKTAGSGYDHVEVHRSIQHRRNPVMVIRNQGDVAGLLRELKRWIV